MSNIEPWSPFQELERFRESIMGSDWFAPLRSAMSNSWGPAIDLRETNTDIIVHAEVPGVNPDDLEVIIEEHGLTLRGEVRNESQQNAEGYQRIERRYGRFHRAIPFPVPVRHDQAVASYRDGILEIRAPKAGTSTQAGRRLQITRGDNPPVQ